MATRWLVSIPFNGVAPCLVVWIVLLRALRQQRGSFSDCESSSSRRWDAARSAARRSRATRCTDLSRRRVVFSISDRVAGFQVASATACRTWARGFSANAAANTRGSAIPGAIASAASAVSADLSAARWTAGWLRIGSGVSSSIRLSRRPSASLAISSSPTPSRTSSGTVQALQCL